MIANETGNSIDHRKARRFICDGKAELCLDDTGAVLIGQLHDMSESGCMMISPARKPVQVGMAAQLFFSVPSGRFQIQATVRSARPGQRIGLEFQFESDRHRSEFNQLFYDIAH